MSISKHTKECYKSFQRFFFYDMKKEIVRCVIEFRRSTENFYIEVLPFCCRSNCQQLVHDDAELFFLSYYHANELKKVVDGDKMQTQFLEDSNLSEALKPITRSQAIQIASKTDQRLDLNLFL